MKYIAMINTDDGPEYLTPRRATERMYKARSTWSRDINDAKIFNTKEAATNSGKRSGAYLFDVRAAKIEVVE